VRVVLIIHHIDFHHIITLECLNEILNFEFHFIYVDIGAPESGLILIGLNRRCISQLVFLWSEIPWVFIWIIHYPLSLIVLIQHSPPLLLLIALRRFLLTGRLLLSDLSLRLRLRLRTEHSFIGSLRLSIWHLINYLYLSIGSID
jgi:hypothetical protein